MRRIERLSALAAARLKKPGTYADGGGLALQVAAGGGRSWIFRYMIRGRAREMGLGPFHTVSLAEARQAATNARKLLLAGVDPLEQRAKEKLQAQLKLTRAVTFKEAAEKYIESHKAGWRNAKHAAQWTATLETYAYGVIGDMPVHDIGVAAVTRVLEAIWHKKPETASRLRGRIESILDWARVRGYRDGDNPARWKGHLENLLPARAKVRRVVHHPALPFREMADFMVELKSKQALAARALEFVILTACRSNEALGARWREFDLEKGEWTVPADRMKAGREFRAPLATATVSLLKQLSLGVEPDPDAYVFPGERRGRPLSGTSMKNLLKRMGRTEISVHGMRSAMRDFASEVTSHSREVCEMALAHSISDKVEAAYRRGDLFDKRRQLMAEWAQFCLTPTPPIKDTHESLEKGLELGPGDQATATELKVA